MRSNKVVFRLVSLILTAIIGVITYGVLSSLSIKSQISAMLVSCLGYLCCALSDLIYIKMTKRSK